MISKNAKIGHNTFIIEKNLVYIENCMIGSNCKIHAFVTIQKGVKIGNYCKIEHNAFIPTGVTIGNKVFIGQGVCFINDNYPRAAINNRLKKETDYDQLTTIVKDGASIGSNATILGGVIIGNNAIVGAGTVVTKNILDNAIVVGNPAKVIQIHTRDK